MDDQQKSLLQRVRRIARQRLGFEKLYPGQEEALLHVLAGRDTLVVMPTGSGKSAIYQITAYLLPGMTVVVSPLIALQRDQVQAINESLEVGKAAVVNSTLSAADRAEKLEDVENQKVEFVFLAPEQFRNEEILQELKEAKPSLFVVDEAHCISEWGHDFRPDYLRLHSVIETLGHPPVLALTATASPPVRSEIVERLAMHDPALVVHGFDRPNLWLGTRIFSDEVTKLRACVAEVQSAEKPGLVYVATRKHAEEVAGELVQAGVKAVAYHAGMKSSVREDVQNRFMNDEVEVIVATTAFGMGIDKPNVRFVFHYDIPGTVDGYYQEIGRGGRDGKAARALLFYRPEDLRLQRFFASGGQIDVDQVEQVLEVIRQQEGVVCLEELQESVELSDSKLATILGRLEALGAVEVYPTGEVIAVEEALYPDEAAEAAAQAQERHLRRQKSRVEMIRGYAEATGCRRKYLLNYFGEEFTPPCGNCDLCEEAHSEGTEKPISEEGPFPLNSRVAHMQWGVGTVTLYENGTVTVLFEEVGYKTLALDIALETGVLAAT